MSKMQQRHDISHEQWKVISPVLPGQRGQWGGVAKVLGVSCDYLIGYSDFRLDKEANYTASGIGLTEQSMKVFAGLKISAAFDTGDNKELCEKIGCDYEKEWSAYAMKSAQASLNLLNSLISHDKFGMLLQYMKQYRDICNDEDELNLINDFIIEVQSPYTAKKYGSKEELMKIKQEFCLHIVLKYFDDILRDIANRKEENACVFCAQK